MFDQTDIENIGMEFERGLNLGSGQFTDEQVKTMKVAFEMAMFFAFRMIENRVELKDTQNLEDVK